MYKISEAHWSTDPTDGHTQDDADCTYLVLDQNGRSVGPIFSKIREAELFIKSLEENS